MPISSSEREGCWWTAASHPSRGQVTRGGRARVSSEVELIRHDDEATHPGRRAVTRLSPEPALHPARAELRLVRPVVGGGLVEPADRCLTAQERDLDPADPVGAELDETDAAAAVRRN